MVNRVQGVERREASKEAGNYGFVLVLKTERDLKKEK